MSELPKVKRPSVKRAVWSIQKWRALDPAFKYACLILVVLRVSLSLIAIMALYQFPLYHVTYYHGIQPVPPGIANALLGVWQRFDSIWYTKIAMQGYAQGDGTTVFFPLYPVLTRLVGKVLLGNYLLGGIIVSNVAYFLALIALYKLSQLEFDSQVATRAVVYLSVFPTAFFLLGVYTESLFLLFAVAAFYYARKGNWLAASIVGLLAALTKQLGLLLLLPLLYEYLAQSSKFKVQSSKFQLQGDVLLLALIPLGTLAFLLFRHFYIGEPFLTETYRIRWAVNASWPWSNVVDSLAAIFNTGRFPALNPEDTLLRRIFYNSFDLTCVGLFLFLAIASFRRLRLSYGLYMISVLFVVLMQNFRPPYPIAALPRYVLVLFPGFMVLGTMVKNKALHWAMIAFSTTLLSLFTAMFATWRVVA
ncbi:MAG: glycosyltransferase family 39 protein [Anaerolineae bacterium]